MIIHFGSVLLRERNRVNGIYTTEIASIKYHNDMNKYTKM